MTHCLGLYTYGIMQIQFILRKNVSIQVTVLHDGPATLWFNVYWKYSYYLPVKLLDRRVQIRGISNWWEKVNLHQPWFCKEYFTRSKLQVVNSCFCTCRSCRVRSGLFFPLRNNSLFNAHCKHFIYPYLQLSFLLCYDLSVCAWGQSCFQGLLNINWGL